MISDGRRLAVALYGERGVSMDPAAYLATFGYDVPPIGPTTEGAETISAEIVHGLWIARCPCGTPGIPAPGGVVFVEQPALWCVRCGNAELGGQWRSVEVPSAATRAEIERLLLLRPDETTRNWSPGERISDLAADNAAHGLEGP